MIRKYSFLKNSSRIYFRMNSFVSKHFKADPKEIESLITIDMKTEYRKFDSNSIDVKVCNLCSKGNKLKDDNLWKLRIHEEGSFHCFRCSTHGNWFQLKSKARNSSTPLLSSNELLGSGTDIRKVNKVPDNQEALFNYCDALLKNPYKNEKATLALEYLKKERKLNKKVLSAYGVGFSTVLFLDDSNNRVSESCITFPWMVTKNNDSSATKNDSDILSSEDVSAMDPNDTLTEKHAESDADEEADDKDVSTSLAKAKPPSKVMCPSICVSPRVLMLSCVVDGMGYADQHSYNIIRVKHRCATSWSS